MSLSRKKWVVQNKSADFKGLGERLSIDQVTVRLLRNRGLTTEEEMCEFLSGDVDTMHNPYEMAGMKKGIALIREAINQQESIRIIGDYDADGITSAYILHRVIQYLNSRVSVAIPHRVRDGYGLNVNLIEQCREDGITTIITCDNGVSAKEAVQLAKDYGMKVVVTDHHRIPMTRDAQGNGAEDLVAADVIINPKQERCTYPFKDLCGAGVAYKFAIALLDTYKEIDIIEAEKLKNELLMYAAIGTVGDVMDLIGENRTIVKCGLNNLRVTDDPSLVALINECGLNQEAIRAWNIGFQIAPCLNASGRIDSAVQALELLIHKEEDFCKQQAIRLVEMNEERKHLTEKYVEEAMKICQSSEDKVLVVYLPECYESIAGIVAGRIRERFFKPTLVITKGEEMCKGSGRSIPAYPMYEKMEREKELLERFGGHAMAVGFSIQEDNIEILRRNLNMTCGLTEEELVEKISIDVPMPMDYVTMPLVEEFQRLEPYGKGNPTPLFAQKDVELLHVGVVGRERKFMKLSFLTPAGNKMDGMYFVSPEEFEEYLRENYGEGIACDCMAGRRTGLRIAVCYQPEINQYMKRKSLQFQVKHIS